MRAVLYSAVWEKYLKADPEILYIQLEQIDFDKVGDLTFLLKNEEVDEILLLDECEVFDPAVKERAFIIIDHINATGNNPLIGPNDEKTGVRFPDMTNPYSESLNSELRSFLDKHKITHRDSVLFGSGDIPDESRHGDLFSLGCHISNYYVMWIDIAAVHAGIKVGAVVIRKDL